jgi:hypothetical protein
MDYLYAFLTGASLKLYDDLSDNKLVEENGVEMNILKGLPLIFLTLAAKDDFNFEFIFSAMNIFSLLGDPAQYSGAYELSHILFNIILLIISFHSRTYFTPYDFFYIMCFVSVMFLESLLIKEEFSYKKLLTRVMVSINLSIGILISSYFGISKSVIKNSTLALGYALVSCGFQIYSLTRSPVP